MTIINSKDIIVEMIKNNGIIIFDPQVDSIWSYINQAGDLTHAVFMRESQWESPYVYSYNPILLWSRRTGITPEGETYIK